MITKKQAEKAVRVLKEFIAESRSNGTERGRSKIDALIALNKIEYQISEEKD